MGTGKTRQEESDLKWAQMAAVTYNRKQSLFNRLLSIYFIFSLFIIVLFVCIWSNPDLERINRITNDTDSHLKASKIVSAIITDIIFASIIHAIVIIILFVCYRIDPFFKPHYLPAYMIELRYLKNLRRDVENMVKGYVDKTLNNDQNLKFLLPQEIYNRIQNANQELLMANQWRQGLTNIQSIFDMKTNSQDFNSFMEKYKEETIPFWQELLDHLPSATKEWYQVLEEVAITPTQ